VWIIQSDFSNLIHRLNEEIEFFADTAADAAKKVGVAITDFIDSATVFARLGYNTLDLSTPNYDDNVLIITAGNDKPIKVVYEGDPIVLMGDPMSNADFTKDICDVNNEGESFLNDFLKSFKITERNV
jgi:hypothetical protein